MNQEEHIVQRRRLQAAFESVFGIDGQRNRAQQAVWDTLRHWSFIDRSTIYPSPAGVIDQQQFLANEGRRSLFLDVKNLLEKPIDPPAQQQQQHRAKRHE